VKLAAETKVSRPLSPTRAEARDEPRQMRDLFEPQELEAWTSACRVRTSGSLMARSLERVASAVTAPRGTAMALPPPSCTINVAQLHSGVFKFRHTKEPVPTDGDLLETSAAACAHGDAGWYDLPLNDRLAVIQYIKYELRGPLGSAEALCLVSSRSRRRAAVYRAPPPPSAEIVAHGKEVWQQAKCWECHGQTEGDGEKAAGLKDDFGLPIRPAI